MKKQNENVYTSNSKKNSNRKKAAQHPDGVPTFLFLIVATLLAAVSIFYVIAESSAHRYERLYKAQTKDLCDYSNMVIQANAILEKEQKVLLEDTELFEKLFQENQELKEKLQSKGEMHI